MIYTLAAIAVSLAALVGAWNLLNDAKAKNW
ncbi:MAG: hypothetical protein KatS3mg015_1101 [Fimbriimonadales bacterium]|jgi:hypothetical protein|nr:MAG: hypothetical protein KatS3mg015_1101 [Fimbriimonadales bacterium]